MIIFLNFIKLKPIFHQAFSLSCVGSSNNKTNEMHIQRKSFYLNYIWIKYKLQESKSAHIDVAKSKAMKSKFCYQKCRAESIPSRILPVNKTSCSSLPEGSKPIESHLECLSIDEFIFIMSKLMAVEIC